ncbi:MAG: polyprenyl synthetase family protein [Lachnospiraceae bacterium]|nr:polyprenyl synthetase family protein [Lachnospiraceae bacterium]
MNFQKELERKRIETEELIREFLPREEGYQKTVIEAMNYSLLAGGKRLRPLLTTESAAVFGGSRKRVAPFAAALEMIHTYSLVHDDLPAMDNDAYRRGKPTTHVKYGEAMAILAGDGLLNLAFETAAGALTEEGLSAEELARAGKALSVLAAKAGIYGMIGGQTADIEAEALSPGEATKERLLFIHTHKTAALIQAAMMTGAILAGAGEEDIDKMARIGYNIGVAFQIQDDILDVTSSLEVLGKMTGSDEKNEKVTYVTLEGLEQAGKEVARLSEEALKLLASLPGDTGFLRRLTEYLITREK